MSRKTLADYFKPENAGAAAAAAVPGPVSSDSDSDDGNVDAGAAAEYDDDYAGRGNQMHQLNVTKRFMETSQGNQIGENLSGRGILPQTSEARRASKKLLKQQRDIEQQQRLEEQQRQLLQQQRQLLQQQLLEEQQQRQREDQIEANVYGAMYPERLSDEVHGNQLHPQNRARDVLKNFMEKSRANQGGGRRYTKKKSKSKSKKSKSKRNKVQKKKTRRSRRLVK